MRLSTEHNPGCDPKAANPTAKNYAFQPALRADVGWSREALRPRSFNLHGFDLMVHLKLGNGTHFGLHFEGKDPFAKATKSGFIFAEWVNPKAVNKSAIRGTQWLALPDNNIRKLASGIKHLCIAG